MSGTVWCTKGRLLVRPEVCGEMATSGDLMAFTALKRPLRLGVLRMRRGRLSFAHRSLTHTCIHILRIQPTHYTQARHMKNERQSHARARGHTGL